MQAVILEEQAKVSLRAITINETLGPQDVRIEPRAVGICGSDVHYYLNGRIGEFVLNEPMVLGHEAAGVVVEIGSSVTSLKVGDRVCMEPGIPNFQSDETLSGHYNLDPEVRFWATPPIHGCLRDTVVHPAGLTFRIPDTMSFHEGALVEPVAIGVYSVDMARLSSGDVALVIGAGTIGIVTALAAEAAGCSRVILADVKQPKLDFVDSHYSSKITTVNLGKSNLQDFLADQGISGVDVVFEASGSAAAYEGITECLNPCGKIGLIGMPSGPVPIDVVAMQVKEISTFSIFRYVNIFPKVVRLIASGKLDVAPLVTREFGFSDAVAAFEYAATLPAEDVKIMINRESSR